MSRSSFQSYPTLYNRRDFQWTTSVSTQLRFTVAGVQNPSKPNFRHPDQALSYDIVHLAANLTYKSQPIVCRRTLLVNPSDEISKGYKCLHDMIESGLKLLHSDADLATVHAKLLKVFKQRLPEAARDLPPVLGRSLDGSKLIAPDSTDKAKEGDVFVLEFGVLNIPKPPRMKCRANKLDLLLWDTVVVTRMGAEFVGDVPRKYSDIAYFIDDEDNQPNKRKIDLDAMEQREVNRKTRYGSKVNM